MGVWTAEDSVLVLIDYQRGFEVIGSDTNADLPDGSRAPDNAALVTCQGTHLHVRGSAVSRLLKASSLLPPLNRRDFTPAVKGMSHNYDAINSSEWL